MATPVGALACQRDTFLRQLATSIISIAPAAIHFTTTSTNNNKTVASAEKSQVEIVLQDTVLFPEGGGQPHDVGEIALLPAKSPKFKVVNVQRRQNTCVHFIEFGTKEEQEKFLSEQPLKVGDQVEVEVDWARRLDHSQHHSAQHLLTAITEQITGLPTDSWSLSHPTCNILLGRKELTADEVEKIEQKCNELIQANVPINTVTFQSKADVPAARSKGIPADVSGPIRMIDIGSDSTNNKTDTKVDTCLCCGTHMSSLGQLGMLKLLHQESKGNTVRLHFVVGERARKYFSEMYQRERALMKDYGRTPAELVEASELRSKALSASQKSEKKLKAELTGFLAPSIVTQAQTPTEPPQAVFIYHREDADNEMLLAFCEALTKSGVTAQKMCVLVGGALKQDGMLTIVGPSENAVKEFSEKVFLPAVGNGTKGNYVKGVFRGKFMNIATGWKDFLKSKPCYPTPPNYSSEAAKSE
jgi:alanyl-tRNA synthetase